MARIMIDVAKSPWLRVGALGLGLLSLGCQGKAEDCTADDGSTYICPESQICAPTGTPAGCYPIDSDVDECKGVVWTETGSSSVGAAGASSSSDSRALTTCIWEEREGYCFGGVCLISTCGDGIVTGEEVCDPGDDARYEKDGLGWFEMVDGEKSYECTLGCRAFECGNGEIYHQEECDDGNTRDGDGCSSTCQSEFCGNGLVERERGEVCDWGRSQTSGDFESTNSDYVTDAEGNWIIASGLSDDPDSIQPDDYCRVDCLSEASCGNGTLDTALGEVCDNGLHCEDQTSCNAGDVCEDGSECMARSGNGCSADCRSSEFCGNGVVDRGEGEVCDFADGTYVADENGQYFRSELLNEEGELVVDPRTLEEGDYCRLDCLSQGECGNGRIDQALGEVCDDGRQCDDRSACESDEDCGSDNGECRIRAGDGCSVDCRSTEFCGNGIWDVEAGEVCDPTADAEGNAPDCTRSCTLLSPNWKEWVDPRWNTQAAMTYHGGDREIDELTGKRPEMLMLAGSHPQHEFALLWRWMGDDLGWHRIPMKNGPEGVSSLLSYPGADNKWHTIAFGSNASSTWELDWGTRSWTAHESTGEYLDFVVGGQQLVYDTERKVPLTVGVGVIDETNQNVSIVFEWDAANKNWSKVEVQNTPVAETPEREAFRRTRHNYSLAFDTSQNRLMLYGGGAGPRRSDLWAFDQSGNWTQLESPDLANGNGHNRARMVYVPSEDRFYVVGTLWQSNRAEQLWSYDPNAATPETRWTLCESEGDWDGSAFGARAGIAASLSPDGSVLLAGGEVYDLDQQPTTWRVSGCDGVEVFGKNSPPVQFSSPLGLDEVEQELVLLTTAAVESETLETAVVGETWAFDGIAWEKLGSTSSVPSRANASMASHPTTGRPVLYAGEDLNDLWGWTGSEWECLEDENGLGCDQSVSPTTRPVGNWLSLARHPEREVLVTYGAQIISGSGQTNDFWYWNPNATGSTGWIQESRHREPQADGTSKAAPALESPHLESDGKHLFLFGGQSGNSNQNGLWRIDESGDFGFDGPAVRRIAGAGEDAPVRNRHGFAYWPTRDLFVAFSGGGALFPTTLEVRVREEEGEVEGVWTRPSSLEPSARFKHGFDYLPGHGLMAFGGESRDSRLPLSDTWLYNALRTDIDHENCWTDDDEDGDGRGGCADLECASRRCGVVYGVDQFCLPEDSSNAFICRARE